MSALDRLLPSRRGRQLRSGVAVLAAACLALTACGDSGRDLRNRQRRRQARRTGCRSWCRPTPAAAGTAPAARCRKPSRASGLAKRQVDQRRRRGRHHRPGPAGERAQREHPDGDGPGDGRRGRDQPVRDHAEDVTPIAGLTGRTRSSWCRPDRRTRPSRTSVEALKAQGPGVAIAGGSAGGTDHILAGLMPRPRARRRPT